MVGWLANCLWSKTHSRCKTLYESNMRYVIRIVFCYKLVPGCWVPPNPIGDGCNIRLFGKVTGRSLFSNFFFIKYMAMENSNLSRRPSLLKSANSLHKTSEENLQFQVEREGWFRSEGQWSENTKYRLYMKHSLPLHICTVSYSNCVHY